MARHQRKYLEYQADRIEAVLAAHRAPGRITGGAVGPRLIRFDLQPAPHIRLAQVRALADDLALALQVAQIRVSTGNAGIAIEFSNPEPQIITLRRLLEDNGPLPAGSAVLGITADNTPLSARLASPDVAHILVAGTTGCGKSVLLRSITASLIMANTPSAISVLAIDPKGRTFPAGFTCPHLVRGKVVTTGPEALDALRGLVRLMEIRDERHEHLPHIVLLIDELADLIMLTEGNVEQPLVRLTQRGREAGIHVLAATQRPGAAVVSSIMRANFPLRLIGRMVDANDSYLAAGRAKVGADKLNGRGDFIAVSGAGEIRFQAPFTTPKELLALSGSASPSIVLPQASQPEQQPDTPSDLDVLTARFAPWWKQNRERWNAQEWGIQKEAIAALWPYEPKATNAGHWRETLFQIVERMEQKTTTTEFLPALLPEERYTTG